MRNEIYKIKNLQTFSYLDENRVDKGETIREKSKFIVSLLEDKNKLLEERSNYSKWKGRIEGVSSSGHMGSVSSSNFNPYSSASSSSYVTNTSSNSNTNYGLTKKPLVKEKKEESSDEEDEDFNNAKKNKKDNNKIKNVHTFAKEKASDKFKVESNISLKKPSDIVSKVNQTQSNQSNMNQFDLIFGGNNQNTTTLSKKNDDADLFVEVNEENNKNALDDIFSNNNNPSKNVAKTKQEEVFDFNFTTNKVNNNVQNKNQNTLNENILSFTEDNKQTSFIDPFLQSNNKNVHTNYNNIMFNQNSNVNNSSNFNSFNAFPSFNMNLQTNSHNYYADNNKNEINFNNAYNNSSTYQNPHVNQNQTITSNKNDLEELCFVEATNATTNSSNSGLKSLLDPKLVDLSSLGTSKKTNHQPASSYNFY